MLATYPVNAPRGLTCSCPILFYESSMTKRELKKLLSKLMDDPEQNVGEILRISSELAKLDANRVWFSVDAGLIKRLGQELVARQETALAELIKNAYDADATTVNVTFSDMSEPGGTLVVDDDGNGMTREELVSGFMRISTAEKVHAPRSPRYGRQRAGRKGIGRFAAQRLGQKLVLITQTEKDNFALQAEFDWSNFAPDSELVSISSQISRIAKQKTQGTTLRIEGMVDAWSDAKIHRVYRYVLDLLQPLPLIKVGRRKTPDQGIDSYEADPGFEPKFVWQGSSGVQESADEHSMLLQHAAATIKGWIDEKGQAWWRVVSPKHELDDKQRLEVTTNPSGRYPALAGVEIDARYFIMDEDYIPHLLRAPIQETLKNSGGIRLFRNGFRVMPYGQPDVDWLGLDASYAKRTILPQHKNTNFIGFVKLQDLEGTRFEETLSREGLIETDAFVQLTEFCRGVLLQAIMRVASARGVKVRTNDPTPAKTSKSVRQIAEEMDAIAERDPAEDSERDDVVKISRNEAAVISSKLKNLASAQEEEEAGYLKEIGMLRVLASLGLVIGQFVHEIRHDLSALDNDLNSMLRMLNVSQEFHALATRMEDNLKSLQTFAAYFDRTIADNVRRELHPQDLRKVLKRFREVVANRLGSTQLELDVRGANLVTRPMHSSEWMSILLNLFTNAEKAIRKEGVEHGKVLVRVHRKGAQLFIEFADNGCGILEANRERVFEAFFTTSAAPSKDADTDDFLHVQGTGLGLKIVRDTISSAGGSIKVVEPPKGYRTCFQIELPANTEPA